MSFLQPFELPRESSLAFLASSALLLVWGIRGTRPIGLVSSGSLGTVGVGAVRHVWHVPGHLAVLVHSGPHSSGRVLHFEWAYWAFRSRAFRADLGFGISGHLGCVGDSHELSSQAWGSGALWVWGMLGLLDSGISSELGLVCSARRRLPAHWLWELATLGVGGGYCYAWCCVCL